MAYFIPAPTAFATVPNYSSLPWVTGYHLDFLSTTQMFLNAGGARAHANDFAIVYPGTDSNASSDLLLDITAVGPGGCYPKAVSSLTLANNTVFGIYVIAKSSGTSNGTDGPLVSAVIATGDNFLPPGYDVYRRVALCYIDSATKLLIKWIHSGETNDKQYALQDPVQVVTAGSAVAFTNVDLTANNGVVPPGHANFCEFTVNLLASAAGQNVEIVPSVLTPVSIAPVRLIAPTNTLISWSSSLVCGILGPVTAHGNAAVNYKVSNAAAVANIYVSGFSDDLGSELF